MAAIAHGSAVVTAPVTHTGDANYTDITGASLASSNFVAGQKYLIVALGLQNLNSVTGDCGIRAQHGTTPFAESEFVLEPDHTGARYAWMWFTAWTAVSGEAISLQHKTITTTDTVSTDDIVLFFIRLDADLTENTDWKFAEHTTDTGLTTTPAAFATASITPGNDSTWLVLGYAQSVTQTLTVSHQFRLGRSGEASSSIPESVKEPEDATNDIQNHPLVNVFTLGAGQANTFTVEGLLSGTGAAGDQHVHSAVFLLNLDKFKNQASTTNAATVDLANGTFPTQIDTLGITPDGAGDVWIMNYWVTGHTAQALWKNRLQVDNADQPGTQTSANYNQAQGADARDQVPLMMQAVVNLTAAAHTIDVDGACSNAGAGKGAKHRTLFAVTMELAASVGTLTASAVAGAAAVATATLTPGAVVILATAVASAPAVPTATLAAVASLTATAVAGAAAVVDATLTPGAVSIPATAVAASGTVSTATLAPGALALTAASVAGAAATVDAVLTPGGATLTAASVAGTAAVADGQLLTGAAITATSVAGAAAVVAATLTPGAAPLTATAVAGAAAVVDTILASGNVLLLDVVAGAAAVVTATLTPGGASFTATAVAGAAAVSTGDLLAGVAPLTATSVAGSAAAVTGSLTPGNAPLNATAVAGVAAVPDAQLSGGAEFINATVVAGAVGVPTATLTPGTGPLTAASVAGAAAVPTATLTAGGVVALIASSVPAARGMGVATLVGGATTMIAAAVAGVAAVIDAILTGPEGLFPTFGAVAASTGMPLAALRVAGRVRGRLLKGVRARLLEM